MEQPAVSERVAKGLQEQKALCGSTGLPQLPRDCPLLDTAGKKS